jgi:hypothetical protein
MWFATLQFLARSYQIATNIACFEPASEPHLTHGTAATGYAPCHSAAESDALSDANLQRCSVAAIREVDAATPIAVAATGYAACLGLGAADKLDDNNLLSTT